MEAMLSMIQEFCRRNNGSLSFSDGEFGLELSFCFDAGDAICFERKTIGNDLIEFSRSQGAVLKAVLEAVEEQVIPRKRRKPIWVKDTSSDRLQKNEP